MTELHNLPNILSIQDHTEINCPTSAHVPNASTMNGSSAPRFLNCTNFWLRMWFVIHSQSIRNTFTIHKQYIQCYSLCLAFIRNSRVIACWQRNGSVCIVYVYWMYSIPSTSILLIIRMHSKSLNKLFLHEICVNEKMYDMFIKGFVRLTQSFFSIGLYILQWPFSWQLRTLIWLA